MVRIARGFAVTCVLSALCVTGVGAETVVWRAKMTGGTVQSAYFLDFGPGVGASIMQTILMDGTPAVIVQWGGPTGAAAGAVPASAVSLRGDRIEINLDVTMLPPGAMQWGNPGTCVGTFAAAPDDGHTYVQWLESSGTQTTRWFQPFWWFPGGGGLRYETRTTGRTNLGTARFNGTCAGVAVSASSPTQTGNMNTHVGNMTEVVTQLP